VPVQSAAAVVLDAGDQRGVAVGVNGAKQGLSEGLKFAGMLLDLRAEQLGETVTARRPGITVLVLEVGRDPCAGGISLEVSFDAEQRAEVINKQRRRRRWRSGC